MDANVGATSTQPIKTKTYDLTLAAEGLFLFVMRRLVTVVVSMTCPIRIGTLIRNHNP
jgi:hypothetical protein